MKAEAATPDPTPLLSQVAKPNNLPCYYFFNGFCNKGDRCSFLHSPAKPSFSWKLSKPPPVSVSPPAPTAPKTAMAAVSAHIDPKSETPPLTPAQVNKATVPCYYYLSGFCNKGDRCSFMHAPEKNTFAWKLSKPTPTSAAPPPPTVSTEKPASLVPPEARAGAPKPELGKIHSPMAAPKTADVRRPERPVLEECSGRGRYAMCPEECPESSPPGFDVLVDDGPDDAGYEDDLDYTLGLESGDDRFLGRDEPAVGDPFPDMGMGVHSSALSQKRAGDGVFSMDLREHLRKRRTSKRLGRQLTSEIRRNGEPVGQEGLPGRSRRHQYRERRNFVASEISAENQAAVLGEIREDRRVGTAASFEGPKPLSEILKKRQRERDVGVNY